MTIKFSLEHRMPQTIRIDVRGPDVTWLDGNRDAAQDRSENALPDIVERWVRAVNSGLLGGTSAPPSQCKATLTARRCDGEKKHQVWEVEVVAVDWGALRVLGNLLLARDFEEGTVRTLPSASGPAEMLDWAAIDFPVMPNKLPFAVERPAEGETPECSVQLCFGQASDETVDGAILALDLWGELVVFGGYAPPDIDPKASGSLPTGAILYDEFTVAQGFFGAFVADAAAFDAVISYALGLAARKVGVASVSIQ